MDIETYPGPHFMECCCCIPLKVGANILGIFAMIGAVFGVIDLFIYFGNPLFSTLAIVGLGLSNFIPAIAYGMMLAKTTPESKKRFALWYLWGFGLGLIVMLVFLLIGGIFIASIISSVIDACIIYYFFLCLKAYAKTDVDAVVVTEVKQPLNQ